MKEREITIRRNRINFMSKVFMKNSDAERRGLYVILVFCLFTFCQQTRLWRLEWETVNNMVNCERGRESVVSLPM